MLEQDRAGANLMDSPSAINLDHELAVVERPHYPMDVGVDHDVLADEVGRQAPR